MFRSGNATWKVYLIAGLALLLTLSAAGCTAKASIPVTGPQQLYVPEVAEGSLLEIYLHTGKPNPVIAPDASLDFGTSYWLIVGPAGGEPISTNP